MRVLLILAFLKSFKLTVEISHDNYFSLFMPLEQNKVD